MSQELSSDAGGRTSRQRYSASEIARRLGISTASVSYALNGKPGVSESTRKSVISIATELGIRPKSPENIALTRAIAFVVPNLTNPMYTYWSHEVIESCHIQGFEVIVVSTDDLSSRFQASIKMLVNRKVDGAIIVAAHETEFRALEQLRDARIPFTFLSRVSTRISADAVVVNDFEAARQMVRHLLEHDPSSVATVVGSRKSSASANRERGFIHELKKHGYDLPMEYRISTDLSREGGRKAGQYLLGLRSVPRAILGGSDEISLGLMETFAIEGLRIGDDISITGYDGLKQSTSPLIGLTAIIQPVREMARVATAQLFERIRSPFAGDHKILVMEHAIHIGRTCGCNQEDGKGKV